MAVSKLSKKPVSKGPKAVLNLIIWVVALIVLVFLAFSIFKPKGAVVDDETPETLIRSYTDFVAIYRPPSQTTPSVSNVNTFFKYFDQSSEEYFDEHFEEMAWIRLQANPSWYVWEEMTKGEKQGEAVKFLITFGALKGGSIQSKKEEGGVLKIQLLSTGQRYDVEMVKSSTGWRFADLMGQTSTLNQRLATVQLPKAGK